VYFFQTGSRNDLIYGHGEYLIRRKLYSKKALSSAFLLHYVTSTIYKHEKFFTLSMPFFEETKENCPTVE